MRKYWIQITSIFVIGLILGMAAGRWSRWHCRPHGKNGTKYDRMLKHFNRKLDLTTDQREKVKAILDKKRQKMEAMSNEFHPKFKKLRESTKNEIRELLGPEQLEKFEAMEAKHAKRWKKFHHPHHSPHGMNK